MDDRFPDVYADNLSVTRSALGFTLDFLRSNPALPTVGGEGLPVEVEIVARLRCSDAFISLLLQVLTQSMAQPPQPWQMGHREGRTETVGTQATVPAPKEAAG